MNPRKTQGNPEEEPLEEKDPKEDQWGEEDLVEDPEENPEEEPLEENNPKEDPIEEEDPEEEPEE